MEFEKTIRMPEATKVAWLEGLRSGNFVQGFNALESVKGGFCCLGVLQKVLDGDVERGENLRSYNMPSPEWRAKHSITFPVKDQLLHQWALPSVLPRFVGQTITCARANDGLKMSFAKIADALEKHIETF